MNCVKIVYFDECGSKVAFCMTDVGYVPALPKRQ